MDSWEGRLMKIWRLTMWSDVPGRAGWEIKPASEDVTDLIERIE